MGIFDRKSKYVHKSRTMSRLTYCNIDIYKRKRGRPKRTYRDWEPQVDLSYYWKEITCPECKKEEKYSILAGEARGSQRTFDRMMILLDSKRIPKASPTCNIKNAVLDEIINDMKITFRME